jgi:hypothetical protein
MTDRDDQRDADAIRVEALAELHALAETHSCPNCTGLIKFGKDAR